MPRGNERRDFVGDLRTEIVRRGEEWAERADDGARFAIDSEVLGRAIFPFHDVFNTIFAPVLPTTGGPRAVLPGAVLPGVGEGAPAPSPSSLAGAVPSGRQPSGRNIVGPNPGQMPGSPRPAPETQNAVGTPGPSGGAPHTTTPAAHDRPAVCLPAKHGTTACVSAPTPQTCVPPASATQAYTPRSDHFFTTCTASPGSSRPAPDLHNLEATATSGQPPQQHAPYHHAGGAPLYPMGSCTSNLPQHHLPPAQIPTVVHVHNHYASGRSCSSREEAETRAETRAEEGRPLLGGGRATSGTMLVPMRTRSTKPSTNAGTGSSWPGTRNGRSRSNAFASEKFAWSGKGGTGGRTATGWEDKDYEDDWDDKNWDDEDWGSDQDDGEDHGVPGDGGASSEGIVDEDEEDLDSCCSCCCCLTFFFVLLFGLGVAASIFYYWASSGDREGPIAEIEKIFGWKKTPVYCDVSGGADLSTPDSIADVIMYDPAGPKDIGGSSPSSSSHNLFASKSSGRGGGGALGPKGALQVDVHRATACVVKMLVGTIGPDGGGGGGGGGVVSRPVRKVDPDLVIKALHDAINRRTKSRAPNDLARLLGTRITLSLFQSGYDATPVKNKDPPSNSPVKDDPSYQAADIFSEHLLKMWLQVKRLLLSESFFDVEHWKGFAFPLLHLARHPPVSKEEVEAKAPLLVFCYQVLSEIDLPGGYPAPVSREGSRLASPYRMHRRMHSVTVGSAQSMSQCDFPLEIRERIKKVV